MIAAFTSGGISRDGNVAEGHNCGRRALCVISSMSQFETLIKVSRDAWRCNAGSQSALGSGQPPALNTGCHFTPQHLGGSGGWKLDGDLPVSAFGMWT